MRRTVSLARILLVDDDQDILKLGEKLLSGSGHVVITASDALKAMQLLDQFQFDLLLSDANMPHFSGFDLVQTVRKQERHASMGIAMLTGRREKKDIEHGIRVGVDDYIIKPLDPMILLEKVEALFEKRPPAKHPEIRFSDFTLKNEVRLMLKTHIISISELGIEVVCSHVLNPGDVIELRGHIFGDVGFTPPPMKVLTCEPISQGYQCQLLYLGASEAMLQKIRRWIYSHGSVNTNKEAA